MSNLTQYITRQEIKKRIDVLNYGDTAPSSQSSKAFAKTETPSELHISDISAAATHAISELDKQIKSVSALTAGDPVFETYAELASKLHPPVGTPTPNIPRQLINIVARDVYKRQPDPRIVLLKDAHRSQSMLQGIQKVYSEVYSQVLKANRIFDAIGLPTLIRNIYVKDRQIITSALDFSQSIEALPNYLNLPSNDFFNGLLLTLGSEAITAQKTTNHLTYVLSRRVDSMFEDYQSLDSSMDEVYGDSNLLYYQLASRAPGLGMIAGGSESLLSLTDGINTGQNPDADLEDCLNQLDQGLFDCLGTTESIVHTQDRVFLTSFEGRAKTLDNLKSSTNLKKYLGCLKNIKPGAILTDEFRSNLNSKIKQVETASPAVLSAVQELKRWL